MLRQRLALVTLILLGLFSAAPARAAGVAMQVEAHFAGHFKFGEWLPLRISLANDGPALHAEVWADTTDAGGQTTYVAPVELPAGARKRLTLYVRPPSFARALRVRLMEVPSPDSGPGGGKQAGRVLDSQTVDVTIERNVNYLIGVIAPRQQAFTLLAGLTLNNAPEVQLIKGSSQYPRPVKAIPIPLGDIPERAEGLRVLDALIISGQDTSELTPEQGQALQGWVEQGGRLILGGGAAATRTLAGLPASLVQDLHPSQDAAEVDVASLSALGDFAGEQVRTPGPFVAAWPAGGQSLVEQDNHPLLVEKRLGEGRVNYAALDLAISPFDAWAGAASFWEKLLTPGSMYPSGAPPDVSPRAMRANSMSSVLQNLPALALPSIGWLAGLLGVYILLVGPVSYLVLRRLRRLALGWLTIPTLTLLFSVGAFVSAYRVRGGDVIINKVSLIALGANSQQPMETFVGIFSPARQAYTLTFPGQASVAPIAFEGNPWGDGGAMAYAGAEIVEGESTQVRGMQVNQWAMQSFYVESPLPAEWKIESNLTLEGDHIRGTLVNRTGQVVADGVLVYANRYLRLGELAPGQEVTIDQTLASPGLNQSSFPYSLFENYFRDAGPRGPSREVQIRQQLLSSYFQPAGGPAQPPSGFTLIGWLQTSPLDVQTAGVRWATQQASLVVANLKVRYAPGLIHLAPGDLTAKIVPGQGEVGICGPLNQVFLASGQATLEFSLPEGLRNMKVARLALVIQDGSADMPVPTLELADRTGQWIKIDSPKMGRNELDDPARFVAADGTLRLRLSSEGGAMGRGGVCLTYHLDIEGELPEGTGE